MVPAPERRAGHRIRDPEGLRCQHRRGFAGRARGARAHQSGSGARGRRRRAVLRSSRRDRRVAEWPSRLGSRRVGVGRPGAVLLPASRANDARRVDGHPVLRRRHLRVPVSERQDAQPADDDGPDAGGRDAGRQRHRRPRSHLSPPAAWRGRPRGRQGGRARGRSRRRGVDADIDHRLRAHRARRRQRHRRLVA